MTKPVFTVSRAHLLAASLMGAAGVALMAAGAHLSGSQASTAGQMLLFHAPAAMAATLGRRSGALHDMIARYAIFVLLMGVALFSADLALRAFGGDRLFPMAAPIGGTLTILGWLGLALSALVPARQ
jgi:uncharacterized membrane protein YgdD (TMEM256/DUF423 family)